jgi:hypothetical protein
VVYFYSEFSYQSSMLFLVYAIFSGGFLRNRH